MAAIANAVESFEGEITHTSEGTSVVFILTVTDDASGFDIDDDVTIVSVPVDAPAATKPTDAEVTEDPAGTFTFAIAFPQVTRSMQYKVTVGASGVVGLSSDKSVTIVVLKDIAINHTFGQVLNFPIRITGNNVNQVDVQGLLQPLLYHHWDETTGMLYIRSLGAVETLYKDVEFTVFARDDTGLIDVGGILNVQQPAPAIRLPTDPLKFYFGRENQIDLQIDNRPSKVEVIGTWLGLSAMRRTDGVRFKGTLPALGDAVGEMRPGVNSGEFAVKASNAGNDPVYADVPWVIVSGKPQFRDTPLLDFAVLNEGFADTIVIDADPRPTVVIESGSLPTGLTLATAYLNSVTTVSFTGTSTAAGTFKFKLKATNSDGATISSEYEIIVYTSRIAPKAGRVPRIWNRRVSDFPLDMSAYFRDGVPPGTWSLGFRSSSLFAIDSNGIVTLTGTPRFGMNTNIRLQVDLTNSEGRARVTSIIIFRE